MNFFVKKIVNSIFCLFFLFGKYDLCAMDPNGNHGALAGADEDEPAFCVICLEPDADENPFVNNETIPCGHTAFHGQCLATWFQHGATCPLCRAVVINDGAGPAHDGAEPVNEEVLAGEEDLPLEIDAAWERVDPAVIGLNDEVIEVPTVYGATMMFRRRPN